MESPPESELLTMRQIRNRRLREGWSTSSQKKKRTKTTTHNGGGATDLHIDESNSGGAMADVSLSLASHVITAYAKDKNLVISPLSINVVLGMVAAGSNGPTRDQILGFLKSKSIEEINSFSSKLATHVFADGEPLGGPRLSTANGVWIDQSLRLKPAFKETVENSYKAASNHVDFQTKADEVREEVNAWAEKETNGLIKDLLQPGSVDAFTRLIFANAVYFKGVWMQEFKASSTRDHNFFLLNGSSVKAPFMKSWEDQYISEFDGFKVLRLPYKQGKDYTRTFSMYFFLPDAKDGLVDLLEKAGSESGFIKNHIPDELVEVDKFRIPKFKIGFSFGAGEVIKALGVVLPFREGNLTEMVDSDIDGKELRVSGIIHKAFIEVNERGTEAAAATAIDYEGCCGPSECKKIYDFVADHPFMFVIREDTSGVVLFVGQLLDPLANS
ncbi:hypothetical protein ABFX02_03G049100 [Erythranthe guttata]